MSQTGKTETSVRSVNVFRIDSCLLEHWPLNLLIFFLFSFQTKEALFTILQDLRPEDHFNIIGFSNRIKVWQQDRLVPVTPNNIRDAKKYIHNMSPTGGRNEINIVIQNSVPLQNVVVKKNNISVFIHGTREPLPYLHSGLGDRRIRVLYQLYDGQLSPELVIRSDRLLKNKLGPFSQMWKGESSHLRK